MKFGLAAANTIPFTDPDAAHRLAVASEAAGFDSIWTVEHVVWPSAYDSEYPYHPSGKMPGTPSIPIPDPLIWLTWVAAVTSTIRLGTGVMILPQRNPVVLAKEVATLDHLSGGRVELGVGVGWLREEFEALGAPWDDRGRRTDEHIEAMRLLWRVDEASYAGRYVRFQDVSTNPKPVAGSVPITIGGHSEAAARRAARLGDAFYPGPGSVDLLEIAIQRMQAQAERSGRDPREVEVSAAFPGRLLDDPVAAVERMAVAGVDRLMVPAYLLTRGDFETTMGMLAELVAGFS